MVFNGLLIIFDIRNVTQWAYLFTIIRIPVKKLQHIVSSILGPVTVGSGVTISKSVPKKFFPHFMKFEHFKGLTFNLEVPQ